MKKKDGKPGRPGKPFKTPKPGKRPGNAGRGLAEDALENSLSLLRATLESTADGILVVDKNGQDRNDEPKFPGHVADPRCPADSGRMRLLLDYVLDPAQGPRWVSLAKVNKLYAHPSRRELRCPGVQGRPGLRAVHPKPQEIKSKIIGRVWSFHDITETKRAERIHAAVYRISEIANRPRTSTSSSGPSTPSSAS